MNSKIVESRISARNALILLLSLPLLIFPALAYDFTGTVVKVSEPNSMTVNVTQPGTYGLQATLEVLLDKPLADLARFKGKELRFEVKGHDILGRLVCDAYLNDINIRDVYSGWQTPVYYVYQPRYPDWEWTGAYYAPCVGQCRSYYPYYPYYPYS